VSWSVRQGQQEATGASVASACALLEALSVEESVDEREHPAILGGGELPPGAQAPVEARLGRVRASSSSRTQPVSRIAPTSVRFLPQFIWVRSMNSVPFFTPRWTSEIRP
jgi:hypothetical protein